MRKPDTKREAALRRGVYAAMARVYESLYYEWKYMEFTPPKWKKTMRHYSKLMKLYRKKAGIKTRQ